MNYPIFFDSKNSLRLFGLQKNFKFIFELYKKKKLPKVIKKSEDRRSMTFEYYEMYIDNYTKKSKYPDIN